MTRNAQFPSISQNLLVTHKLISVLTPRDLSKEDAKLGVRSGVEKRCKIFKAHNETTVDISQ